MGKKPTVGFTQEVMRVLRLISFTCLSADPFGPVLGLILNPSKD